MNIPGVRTEGFSLGKIFEKTRLKSGMTLGIIIVTALIAFEMFNYSTTDYALQDLLGPLTFLSIRWSTILAVAFCGIDFAGIARLFTNDGRTTDEPKQAWYLFGAWLLAATMNALLTWWGVSMAVSNHTVESTAVIDSNTLTRIIPVFVALMVWVIRILLIGTISVSGKRLFNSDARPAARPRLANMPGAALSRPTLTRINRDTEEDSPQGRSEPRYQPMTIGARPATPRPIAREAVKTETRKF
jgi:hypothetical protein